MTCMWDTWSHSCLQSKTSAIAQETNVTMFRWLQDVFDVPLVIQLTGNCTLYYFIGNF